MLDRSSFRYVAADGVWLRGGEPEVAISGTEEGPLPGRVAVAEIVLADLDGLTAVAGKYMDAFVDRARFAPGGLSWELDSIEFGRSGDEPVSEFTAHFHLAADLYGDWAVTFRYDARVGIQPCGFGRRQI